MKDIKRTDLIACAVELNTLLDPDPKIKTVAIKTEELIKAITKAAGLIEEGDKISEATSDMLITLEIKIPEGVIVETADENEDAPEEKNKITLDDLVTLAGQMNDIMALAPAIEIEGEDFNTLKAVILENCYEGKECQIYATDEFSVENWLILKALGIVPITEDGKPAEAPTNKPEKAEKAAKEKPAKKEKTVKKEKQAKAEKNTEPRYTRDMAVAEAIRKLCKVGATAKQIMDESDKIFVAQGGSSNPTAINVNRYIVSGLIQFGVLNKTGDILKLA